MMLLGFAVAAAYGPGLPSEALAPRWAAIAVGVPLVSRLDPRALGAPLCALLAILVGFGALSLAWSPAPFAGTQELFFILMLCGVCLAGAGLDDLDGVMTGLGLGLLLSSVIAVVQWLGWEPVAHGSGRPGGLFFNSEVLAEFSALVLVWALLRPRWWLVGVALVPLLLCQSRVAVLTALAAVFYVSYPRPRGLRVLLGAMIVSIGGVAIVSVGADKLASAGERIILWLAMGEAITPLGRGLGWVEAALPVQSFAHSDVLQILVEFGWPGALLILLPIAAFRRHRGNLAERALLVAVCFQAVVSFPLRVPASAFVAALVAGYLAGGRHPLRLGRPLGGNPDGDPLQRQGLLDRGGPGPSGWRGRPLPLRSDAAPSAS